MVFSPSRRGEPAPALGYRVTIIGAALVLLLIAAVAIAVGPYRLAARDLVAFLVAKATGAASPLPLPAETVILQIRLPRVLAALAVGASLAASMATTGSDKKIPTTAPNAAPAETPRMSGETSGLRNSD